jgi:flavorubredoxin
MSANLATGHALVVYESMFGNTRLVAEAIGEGLREHFATVDVVDASAAPTTVDGIDLLVVGAPTHALGMPRAKTRAAAREQGATGPTERGVREWLAALVRPQQPIAAVAFDTRVKAPIPGSARRPINRRLRRLGFQTATPVSFVVTGTPGPLAEGELDKARRVAAMGEPAMAEVRSDGR